MGGTGSIAVSSLSLEDATGVWVVRNAAGPGCALDGAAPAITTQEPDVHEGLLPVPRV